MILHKSLKGYYYLQEGGKSKRISKTLFHQMGGLPLSRKRPFSRSQPAKVIYEDRVQHPNSHVSCFKYNLRDPYYCHGTDEKKKCHYGENRSNIIDSWPRRCGRNKVSKDVYDLTIKKDEKKKSPY